MENQPSQPVNVFNDGNNVNLPNSTAVLVLGIISIVGCFCYGIVGLACGIIALVLASKDLRLYNVNKGGYTVSSYNNLKAGRICAIVGTSLSAIYLIFAIVMYAMVGSMFLSHPEQFFRH